MKARYLILMAGVVLFAGNAWAKSGSCGANEGDCYWDFTDGVLTISGNGAMKEYDDSFHQPWFALRFTSVVVGDGVTSIGSDAFSFSGLTSIEIPDSVTSIGDWAFRGTKLTSIEIPDSVTSIGSYAFYNASSLQSITIPDSVTSIGGGAFSGASSLQSITIPDSVTSIGDRAFVDTKLTSIEIPDSVTSIEEYAFAGASSLQSITIPDSVTSIGNGAFSGTQLTQDDLANVNPSLLLNGALIGMKNLTSFTIPEGTTSIGREAFRDAGLTSIEIPDSVTSIGYSAFSGTQLTQDDLANVNPSLLLNGALVGMKNLTSFTIPDSVTSIGGSAFANTGLTSIVIPDSVTSIGSSAFLNIPSDAKIYCQDTSESRCSKLMKNNKSARSKLVLYEKEGNMYRIKDQDGHYTYFDSAGSLMSGTSCGEGCEKKYAFFVKEREHKEALTVVEANRTSATNYTASEAAMAATGHGNNSLSFYFR